MSKRFAVISIGTNSTRLLLADVEPELPRVELARSVGTRIGEGLKERGPLAEEPVRRTLDAIAAFHRAARGHYLRIFAIATSALRRAENGDAFAERVRSILGVPLRVLSGEEEATASYRGALTALEPRRGERCGVVDAGAGSTEYAAGATAQPEHLASCEIGAVVLTEAVPALAGRDGALDAKSIDRARALARAALEPLREFPSVERMAFVGGSATTAASIARGRAGDVAAYRLTRADLSRLLERLGALGLDERKRLPGMKPQRADILPAGIIVLDEALAAAKLDAAVATTADLLLGFLIEQRGEVAEAPRRPARRSHP